MDTMLQDAVLQADSQTRCYRDLLYGGTGQAEGEGAEMPEDGRWRTVVYVEIGDEDESAALAPDLFQRERFLLREVKERFKERMPEIQLCYIASHGCCSVVMVLASAEETIVDGMWRQFEECRSALSQSCAKVTIGVSVSSQRLREIRRLFRQAEHLVRGSVKGGGGVVVADPASGAAFGRSPGNRRHLQLVADIRNYIRKNAASIENVDQVAGVFYLSSRYANQLFKHYTGQTIFDFLVESRLEAAKKLLTAPQAKVYEVSEQIGYQNHSYFSSLFKQNTGLTPKQYMDIYGRTS